MTEQRHGHAKRRKHRKWPWILGVLLLLGVIVAVTTNLANEPTANPPAPEQVAEPEAAAIGQPVRDGNFEFTITGVERQPSVGDPSFPQYPQGEYVVIPVRVVNVGTDPRSLTDTDQYLYDTSARQYSADSAAGVMIPGNEVLYTPINPGNNVEGELVFDVPPGTELDHIELHDSFLSEGATVTLR
ncbi:DUF4352 domain-containing protein [Saccharomonospora saliphila]|uniref:DUF4352 domain-containing protein n=1 Tax=Saccharomonospora saliphila TaxID=369829 RepID=UPI0003822C5F|nr:DUF4352 domain-containing protein [Saccharomonospora saliphila]